MNIKPQKDWSKLTPERTQAWGLAMYPIIVLVLAVFMVVTRRPITTDISGLLLGLTVAGSLQAAVKRKVDGSAESNNTNDPGGNVRGTSNTSLENSSRGRTGNPDNGSNSRIRICFS